MDLTLLADYACQTGEGPLWHPDENAVYWVDIPRGRLFRYDCATGEHGQVLEGEALGGFTIQADGALLLFGAEGRIRLWREGELTTVVEAIDTERGNRFNDVIADPEGRVYCGTMRTKDHPGTLYRLDLDGTLTVLWEGVQTSNGFGFTPDLTGLYYTESGTRTIHLYDYDRSTGELSNRRPWLVTPADEGVPDGMCVDAEGYVWSAKWDGWMVVRYAPDGTEERRLEFPVKKCSCVTFGGADYGDLYVTTAGGHLKETDGPTAGALYRCRPGVTGVPEYRSRIATG